MQSIPEPVRHALADVTKGVTMSELGTFASELGIDALATPDKIGATCQLVARYNTKKSTLKVSAPFEGFLTKVRGALATVDKKHYPAIFEAGEPIVTKAVVVRKSTQLEALLPETLEALKDETAAFEVLVTKDVVEVTTKQNAVMMRLCELVCSAEKKVSLAQAAAWLHHLCGGRTEVTTDNIRYWLTQYKVWRDAGKLEEFGNVKAAVRVEIAKLPGAVEYVKRGKIPTPGEDSKPLKIGSDLKLTDVKPVVDYLRVQAGPAHAPTDPRPLNPIQHLLDIDEHLSGKEGKRWQAFKRVSADSAIRKAVFDTKKPEKLKVTRKLLGDLEAKLDTLLERTRSARALVETALTKPVK